MSIQVSLRLYGWHAKRLEALAKESKLGPCTVARELLIAAIEQASDDPPPRVEGSHLERFYAGRETEPDSAQLKEFNQ
jgi:hypothetical protein